jgi:hypothetical protein
LARQEVEASIGAANFAFTRALLHSACKIPGIPAFTCYYSIGIEIYGQKKREPKVPVIDMPQAYLIYPK